MTGGLKQRAQHHANALLDEDPCGQLEESPSRPKFIAADRHALKVASLAAPATAPVHKSSTGKASRAEPILDSANMLAAMDLRLDREESGLTVEELAALCGEDKMTIWRRENNKVHLGPKRQEIIIARALGLKLQKGHK